MATSSTRETPFVVAFDTSSGVQKGTRLTEDEFYEVLENYGSVIVKWEEGQHSSQEHYLLYGEAKEIDLSGEDVDVTGRKRSHELTGDFKWFKHGEGLIVNMSIGLHCESKEVWKNLP